MRNEIVYYENSKFASCYRTEKLVTKFCWHFVEQCLVTNDYYYYSWALAGMGKVGAEWTCSQESGGIISKWSQGQTREESEEALPPIGNFRRSFAHLLENFLRAPTLLRYTGWSKK